LYKAFYQKTDRLKRVFYMQIRAIRCLKITGKGQTRLGLAVLLSILASVLSSGNLIAKGPPKELPRLVTVSDLASQPGEFDGHRVVVTGRVQSMEIQTGRRGSEYLMLILEEDSPPSSLSGTVQPVQVYSPTIPKVREGDLALVQGVFHKEGRQAGRSFEHFVDAEVILRN
jgi:hypothetical protein